ncbi:MAG: TrkH family potassium uptake protein [Rhodothermales bacterium]|nr:TrkH family potassium uptake protein [Rhodothermales bacterium]
MILNLKAVFGVMGALLFFLGIALLMPGIVGLIYSESVSWTFFVTAVGSMVVGGGLFRGFASDRKDLKVREGFAVVALAWLVLSIIGAIPFVLSGVLETYTDAFFETMSGFTTTGATILGGAGNPAIEDIPRSFLFWRSLAHWIGGMGIIVLTLAILPVLGVGGMQLFKAEVPGPSADKLTPRIRDTAKQLWIIYVGITVAQIVLLLPVMSVFDAVNHAFATMATGGFSTRNGSVGDFGSAYVEWIITLFMILAGVNFALHFRILRGEIGSVFRNTELKVYLSIVAVATVLLTISLWDSTAFLVQGEDGQRIASLGEAVRVAAFQASAIITTTGFATADYELWSALGIGVIFALFFVGGMAGSTGGGMKVVRHVLLFKNSFREIKKLIHPSAVIPIRLSGKVVSADVMRNVLSFAVLYLALLVVGTIVLSFLGLDLLTGLGAAISSVGNVGPAFGTLGPAENYAHLPALAKWVLALMMMAGRLELFTVLILFFPTFWRR